MSATSAEEEAPELQKHPRMAARPQLIQACDFRSAGRLSNESARALTVVYELVARNLAGSLSNYFGTNLIVRLVSLDQVPVGEFVASVAALSFIGTVSVGSVSGSLLLACDIELAFPMIDLLLGGTGVASEPRELSEIEDEIMQDLMLLIARQTGTAWRASETSPPTVVRIAPAALQDVFPTTEKVVLVTFEMALPGITGRLQVMFPSSMVNTLVKQSKLGQPQKKGGLRIFPTASIRERILDCDVLIAADLPSLRVSVRDLIGLQPGSVLKLHAPVRTAGMLTVGGREIFEAVPVRNGAQKAAQVGRRVPLTVWGSE